MQSRTAPLEHRKKYTYKAQSGSITFYRLGIYIYIHIYVCVMLGYCLGGLNLPEISRNMCFCNFSCADPQKNNSGPTQSKP